MPSFRKNTGGRPQARAVRIPAQATPSLGKPPLAALAGSTLDGPIYPRASVSDAVN